MASPKPWERRSNESEQAFAAFRVYLEMPPGDRSIERQWAGKGKGKSGLVPGRIWQWTMTHCWTERARAFDAYMHRIELEEKEKIARRNAAKWEQRREEQRELEYRLGRALQLRASRVLEDSTLQARLRDAATLSATGSKLARLAAEMETDRQAVVEQQAAPLERLGDMAREVLEDGGFDGGDAVEGA
jgi:hypothetical protein